jgi:hypothetical protein
VTRLGVSAGGRLSVNCSTGAVTPCCDSCPALELNLCVSGSCSTVSSSGRAAAWIYTQSRRERQYDFPNQPDLLYEWTRSVDVLRFVIDPDGASLATIGAAVAAEMSAAGITDGGYEVTGDGFLVFVTVWTNCAVSVVAESPPTYTAPSCPTGINANQSENLALGGVPNFHTLGRKSGRRTLSRSTRASSIARAASRSSPRTRQRGRTRRVNTPTRSRASTAPASSSSTRIIQSASVTGPTLRPSLRTFARSR